jgi:hypothetical protein
MLSFLSRQAKSISLISGFLFAIGGALWSFLVMDKLSEDTKRLSDAKADLTRQMQSLNSIASEYFIANQQGDLIFILAQQDSARQDVASLIYKGNVLDRATPVRNMIGALAIAKQLDYRQTYGAYEKFNDETRANLSFANFTKLKQVEKEIIVKGQERIPLLLSELFEIEKAINAKEAAQKENRVIALISSTLGTFLLLCVNLITEKGRAPETIK